MLDVDTRAAERLAGREDVQAFCVWIAPPSLDALRARLRRRGDTSEQIEARIADARKDIDASLSSRFFDKFVINDDLDEAQALLVDAVNMRFSS